MLVDDFDQLAAEQRSVHDKQGAVGTDDVGRGLEVDGFTLRQAAPDRQRNLEGKASGASALRISGSLHRQPRRGRLSLTETMVPRHGPKDKGFTQTHAVTFGVYWVDVPLTRRIDTLRLQKWLFFPPLALE